MGIFDFLKGEFIDVIHWTDDTRDTMVMRFEREGHAIKYGAKLTVREGQAAVFVHEGQLADVFTPGLYMLETNNMPVMTTLQHWDHGFQSPFKSEIYFVATTRFNDLKWGTKNPIMCRDPEFGPVRLRAFGSYSVRVVDPARFLTEIVGTDGQFTMDEISYQIRNIIVQEFSRAIAGSGIPVLDMAANTADLGKLVAAEIGPVVAEYGLAIPELYVENISLPLQRWSRRWTSAPRWASSAIWAAIRSSRPPKPWKPPPRPPTAAWARALAWEWAWRWHSRWVRPCTRRSPRQQRVRPPAPGAHGPHPLPRKRQRRPPRWPRRHRRWSMSGILLKMAKPPGHSPRRAWAAWRRKAS